MLLSTVCGGSVASGAPRARDCRRRVGRSCCQLPAPFLALAPAGCSRTLAPCPLLSRSRLSTEQPHGLGDAAGRGELGAAGRGAAEQPWCLLPRAEPLPCRQLCCAGGHRGGTGTGTGLPAAHRVQPARPAPPAAPALQPPLQRAAHGAWPRHQPGCTQHGDPQPAARPGLALGAAPCRACPLPAAGSRAAGGVGWQRAQPQRGPDSAGEARGGLHRGALRQPVPLPGPFACLAWSHLEMQLLYVAEKSRPTLPAACPGHVPGAARPAEDEDEEGEQFLYHEGWGEKLSTRSAPVLCVLDIKSSSVSVLESVPEHVSPGQALWSPGDTGVVFVGWWHEPFRLGLSACSNRRSGIFHLELASGHCELLSAPDRASFSPRLSPDGQRLLYLEGAVGGPHRQCLQLRLLTWQTRQTVTVLDVVQEPTGSESSFTGIYTDALPLQCWAADSRRALLCTPQRSRTDLLLVDTETATITNLTAGSPEGCWELLTIQWDLLVATCSAPHRPPSLVMAELPPLGQELPLRWVPVEDTPPVPGITWKTLTVQQNSALHNPQPFEALLLSPTGGTSPHPLVVCPHGGPHAVFDARWRPSMAALCWLGFAVLLVNYRGSLGFGQASIECLQSRVGEQDVADTQLAVEQALRCEPLDPHRVALLAGSHGAFIALHLLTRQPERYRACALRNPVSNLPALLGTSDIPDWRYASLGLPYSFQRVPGVEDLVVMLQRSPIIQAPRVRAPVLLCVGAQDRRVSPTQALELYRVLRAGGVPTRLLWYPEGGHALTGVETEANVFGNCARWILQHLGQPPVGQHGP